jgi:Double zinc ribbon
MYRCSFCEHANPLAAKFCNECGSPLNLKPCPQCDAVNGATSKACYMCGAFFPIRGSEPEAPETARSIPDTYTAAGPDVSPDRRPGFAGVMASLLPVIVFGTIAIAAYFVGYQQTGREWLASAWASLGTNRDVVATPTAPATTSVPPSNAPTADADTATIAAAKAGASPMANAPPTDTTTAPPNQVSVPAPGDAGGANSTPPPTQAITPVTSPPQVATAAHATPAATALHTEKKSSTGTKKTAKKAKSTTTRNPAPAQPTAAP